MTEILERRAVAIMFTDMFGYTAELEANESEALYKRSKYIAALEAAHETYGGRIVQRLGDGSMSMFPNALFAVHAAVAMQQQLSADIPVRIGIHFGEVIIEPERLSGMPVNIAARIESFAVPGSVIVSGAVVKQIESGEFEVISLGQFKFKNVGHPCELYAIAAAGLKVPEQNELQGKGERFLSFSHTIPEPKSQIIGRDEEIKRIVSVLESKRMLTITGPGGVGKSRLAIEIGHLLESKFLNGVAFVPLAQVKDLEGLTNTLAEQLDVKEALGRTLYEGITTLIGEHPFLLLLDNLEQIALSGPYVQKLLTDCPSLCIVSTSRTLLHVEEEEELSLSPLAVPVSTEEMPLEVLTEYPAIALLIQKASQKTKIELSQINLSAIASICRLLDGLPLALELAAARLRVLSPQELLKKLDKSLDVLQLRNSAMPERQQTMRAAIGWSHEMLSSKEQIVFRQFSVFVDGCTFANLEKLVDSDDVLDSVDSLIEKSLLFVDTRNHRLKMLNIIREFASEKLEASGEKNKLFQRHAQVCLELAREIRDGIEGTKQLESIEKGIDEEENLIAALEHFLKSGQNGDMDACRNGMRMCGDLWLYWHIRGKNITARTYATSFLEIDKQSIDTVERTGALAAAGLASWTMGHFETANEQWGQAYLAAINLKAERESSLLATLCAVGLIGFDLPRALKLAAEGLQRSKAFKSRWAEGFALSFEALVNLINGNLTIAKSKFVEALAIQEKLEDWEIGGFSLAGLAAIASKSGDYLAAIENYRKSIAAYQIIGDRAEEARIHSEIAWVLIQQNKFDESKIHFLNAIQAYVDIASVRGIGFSLVGLACAEAKMKNFALAVQLAAAAEKFAHEEGMVNLYLDNSYGHKQILDNARSKLDSSALAKAIDAGNKLTINETIELARNQI